MGNEVQGVLFEEGSASIALLQEVAGREDGGGGDLVQTQAVLKHKPQTAAFAVVGW